MIGKIYDATWGRIFATGYDYFLSQAEIRGLGDIRETLLKRAKGAVIEIGAGTGLNVAHYPKSVTTLNITEPNPMMAGQIRDKAAAISIPVEVTEAPGEQLPFPDDSFDTAVMTMVLCTASDPPAVLEEIARVLRPGGQLLFFEHVRADSPALAFWQDHLNLPWQVFGHGCHPNRDSLSVIKQSSLTLTEVHNDTVPFVPPIVRPLIVGRATVKK